MLEFPIKRTIVIDDKKKKGRGRKKKGSDEKMVIKGTVHLPEKQPHFAEKSRHFLQNGGPSFRQLSPLGNGRARRAPPPLLDAWGFGANAGPSLFSE